MYELGILSGAALIIALIVAVGGILEFFLLRLLARVRAISKADRKGRR